MDNAACVLSIGVFDGVHLGHQNLLLKALGQAEFRDLPLKVLTFDPHPKYFFQSIIADIGLRTDSHEMLFSLEDRRRRLLGFGVRSVDVQKFDQSFANQSADQFVEYLRDRYAPRAVVVGYDFRFGQGRAGGPDQLRRAGEKKEFGWELVELPPFLVGSQRVSTSAVKSMLKSAALTDVRRFLGRDYFLSGTVVQGKALGRKLGFPTANLDPEIQFRPAVGVYRTKLRDHTGRFWPAITNVGFRPTVDGVPAAKEIVETHILNFSGDLVGQKIEVHFLEYLRGEIKFQSIDQLKSQIQRDISQVNQKSY